MGNIATGMGDAVSRTVSERTCRGNTRSRGKRKRGKESKSTTTISKNKATRRKGNSLATNAVRRARQAHNYNAGVKRESKARLRGHNPTAGKTPKREAKDDMTRTGCPLGLTKTHQAARQETIAVLLQAVKRSTPPNLPLQRGG